MFFPLPQLLVQKVKTAVGYQLFRADTSLHLKCSTTAKYIDLVYTKLYQNLADPWTLRSTPRNDPYGPSAGCAAGRAKPLKSLSLKLVQLLSLKKLKP